jgi:small-conductance mechanosensitive channel
MKSPDNSLHLDPNFEENIEDTIGRIFGSFKSLTSDLENKYKSVLSETHKLRHKVPILERENRDLKNSSRELETGVQVLKANCERAKKDHKLVEDGLQEAKRTIESLRKQLQDKDEQLKKEQMEKEKLKRRVQGMFKMFQSTLDGVYREENWKETVTWFAGHRDCDLPEVSLKLLCDFFQELTVIWEQLGIALGIEGAVAVERKANTPELDKCVHVLMKWKTLTTASWRGLLNALVSLNHRQLAMRIETKILSQMKYNIIF